MDEVYIPEWEAEWLKNIEHDQNACPYTIGYISPVSIVAITSVGAEIDWYPNTFDRFHAVKTFLPREALVAAVRAREFESRVTVFVNSEWLRKLHRRSYSIFAMIDAVDMKAAVEAGAISHEQLIRLRDALDEIAARYPTISFISFADSLLLKTNWTAGMIDTDVKYTYVPERLFILFQQLQSLYRNQLGLEIYGVFAQGSNEFYDDPLLHISQGRNHISLNSLGLPFAQISLIEAAARKAIKAGIHPRMEIYMDNDLFHSLMFQDYHSKDAWRSAPYKAKMTSVPGQYYYGDCNDLISCLRQS